MQPLDLYLNVSQNITIACTGKNEVHLSGYFEPNNSLEDGMYGQEEMDEDDDEEMEGKLDSDSEDMEEAEINKVKAKVSKEKKKDVQGFEKGGDLDKSLKAAKDNAKKNSKQKVEVTEVSSDDDDEDEDVEEQNDSDLIGNEESGEDFDDLDLDA
jgi:nucleophosmin 1